MFLSSCFKIPTNSNLAIDFSLSWGASWHFCFRILTIVLNWRASALLFLLAQQVKRERKYKSKVINLITTKLIRFWTSQKSTFALLKWFFRLFRMTCFYNLTVPIIILMGNVKQFVGWHYYANKIYCRLSKADLPAQMYILRIFESFVYSCIEMHTTTVISQKVKK